MKKCARTIDKLFILLYNGYVKTLVFSLFYFLKGYPTMKKLFAIMLCALLAVCAVVPSFAATQISSTEMSDAFVEAEIVTVNFVDHLDQPELFNNKDYWAENNGPKWDTAGFQPAETYLTLWGGTNEKPKAELWADKTFQVKFTAPASGLYSFAFMMDSGGNPDGTAYVPVRIDDGEEYQIVFIGAYKAKATTYYGMDEIYLEAGEHVFHVGIHQGTDKTQYYYGFQYTYTADEAGEDTSADDTTTAAPTEDTSATQGGEQTAPATFDAAVIALAVAGASAAVAVVSKKRR